MRPLEDYVSQGIEANFAGTSKDRCPYARGTIAELDWTIGWIEASLETPDIAFELDDTWPDFESFLDDTRNMVDNLKADRRNLYRQARAKLPDLATFEQLCGPTENWKFNCYAISKKIIDSGMLEPLSERFGKARLCYGVFDGDISPYGAYKGRAFARHGWIEFESGLVIDPTLWVFTDEEPEVACTNIEGYDLAAARLNKRFVRDKPAPEFDPTQRVVRWDCNEPEITALADKILGKGSRIGSHGEFSLSQAFYIATIPVEVLGDNAAAFYRVLYRAGCKAMIPLDNRNFVDDLPAPASAIEEPEPVVGLAF